MRPVIVIRSSASYNAIKICDQLKAQWKPSTELRTACEYGAFDLWNELFNISYEEYRESVKRISIVNLSNTNCQILHGYDCFVPWYENLDEDVAIFPIDDDDLFDEKLYIVPYLMGNSPIVSWNNISFSSVEPNCQFYESTDAKLASNNWCVKSSFLKTLDTRRAHKIIFHSHYHSNNFLNKLLGGWKHLNRSFNLYNKHIGSISYIQWCCRNEVLEERFSLVKDNEIIVEKIPDNAIWAEKYIKQLLVLVNSM